MEIVPKTIVIFSHSLFYMPEKAREKKKKNYSERRKRFSIERENHSTSTSLEVSTAAVHLGMDPGGTEANGSISILKGAGQSP